MKTYSNSIHSKITYKLSLMIYLHQFMLICYLKQMTVSKHIKICATINSKKSERMKGKNKKKSNANSKKRSKRKSRNREKRKKIK